MILHIRSSFQHMDRGLRGVGKPLTARRTHHGSTSLSSTTPQFVIQVLSYLRRPSHGKTSFLVLSHFPKSPDTQASDRRIMVFYLFLLPPQLSMSNLFCSLRNFEASSTLDTVIPPIPTLSRALLVIRSDPTPAVTISILPQPISHLLSPSCLRAPPPGNLCLYKIECILLLIPRLSPLHLSKRSEVDKEVGDLIDDPADDSGFVSPVSGS